MIEIILRFIFNLIGLSTIYLLNCIPDAGIHIWYSINLWSNIIPYLIIIYLTCFTELNRYRLNNLVNWSSNWMEGERSKGIVVGHNGDDIRIEVTRGHAVAIGDPHAQYEILIRFRYWVVVNREGDLEIDMVVNWVRFK